MEVRREFSLVKDELEYWKRKHDNLEVEIKTLFEEIQRLVAEKDKTNEQLHSKNQEPIN